MARTERTHDSVELSHDAPAFAETETARATLGAAVGKRLRRNTATAAPGRRSSRGLVGLRNLIRPDEELARAAFGERREAETADLFGDAAASGTLAQWSKDVGFAHGAGRLDDNADADIAAEAFSHAGRKTPFGRQHVLTNDRRGKLRHRL